MIALGSHELFNQEHSVKNPVFNLKNRTFNYLHLPIFMLPHLKYLRSRFHSPQLHLNNQPYKPPQLSGSSL